MVVFGLFHRKQLSQIIPSVRACVFPILYRGFNFFFLPRVLAMQHFLKEFI